VNRTHAELRAAALSAATLVGTSLIAHDGVPDWDAELFDRVNRLGNELEPLLWLPMQAGSLFGPVVATGTSWMAWRDWRTSAGCLVVGVGAWQAAKAVKDRVDRGRPTTLARRVVRRWGTPKDGLGFVSGHSAVAFSLAAVLAPRLGPWRWMGYGVAGTVSFGRIHVGAHFPLDTVGGAALGLTMAHLWNAAVHARL
jgi:undecaprenyl-diphosphatase